MEATSPHHRDLLPSSPPLHPVPSLDRPEMPRVEEMMRLLARGSGEDPLGRICSEHLDGGGKRIRARLALAASEGLGDDPERAIPLAAACELLHNATLIHDDLQDGDRVRRERPTTWAVHGSAQAINAGDLMLMLPWAAAEHLPCKDAVRWQISRAISARARACVRGQALEWELTRRARYDRASWQRAAQGKTGELLALPVEGAALLSGWDPLAAEALGDVFQGIGLLYQLRDDLIDLSGEKGREQPGNDLREGKPSALVVEHLRLHPTDREWLTHLLRTPREHTRAEDVEEAIRRFLEGGAAAAVALWMRQLAYELLSSPPLRSVPAVRGLAEGLIRMLLSPVSSLPGPRP